MPKVNRMLDDADVENELLKLVGKSEGGRLQFSHSIVPASEWERRQNDQQDACLERLVERRFLNKLAWSDNPTVAHEITEAGRSHLRNLSKR